MRDPAMHARVAVLAVAAVLAILVDIWAVAGANARALGESGVRTNATVTSLDDPHSGVYYPDSSPLVEYRFQVRGRRYEGISRITRGRFARLTLGGNIEIAYLPDRPQINTIPGEEGSPSRLMVLTVVSLANGLALVAVLFVAVPVMRGRPRAVRSAQFVEVPKRERSQRRQGATDARHRR
jgi:hypothetical protein